MFLINIEVAKFLITIIYSMISYRVQVIHICNFKEEQSILIFYDTYRYMYRRFLKNKAIILSRWYGTTIDINVDKNKQ